MIWDSQPLACFQSEQVFIWSPWKSAEDVWADLKHPASSACHSGPLQTAPAQLLSKEPEQSLSSADHCCCEWRWVYGKHWVKKSCLWMAASPYAQLSDPRLPRQIASSRAKIKWSYSHIWDSSGGCLSCSILMQQLLFLPLLSVPEHFAAVSVGVQEKLKLKSGIVFKSHIKEAPIIMNV